MVGDTAGNAQKIVAAARAAYAQGARLVLTPELSICGYPAEDLFLRPAFIAACDDAVKTVARELAGLKGLHVVVGHPMGGDIRSKSVQVQRRFNAASVLCEGRVLETYAKRELPNYQVFDERRYFTPGQGTCVFQVEGINVGLLDLRGRVVRRAGAAGEGGGRGAAGRDQCLARSMWARAASASRAWPSAPARSTCRWSMPTSSAGRTRWCSTAPRSPSMPRARWSAARARLPGRPVHASRPTATRERVGLAAHDGARALPRSRPVGRAGAGRARLRRQERLPRRAAGPVRRHRLGPGAGDRRRRAGRRQGAHA